MASQPDEPLERWGRRALATGLVLAAAAVVLPGNDAVPFHLDVVPAFYCAGVAAGYLVAGALAIRVARTARTPSARRLTVVGAAAIPAAPAVLGVVSALRGELPPLGSATPEAAGVLLLYGALFYPVVAAFVVGVDPDTADEPFTAAVFCVAGGLFAVLAVAPPDSDLAVFGVAFLLIAHLVGLAAAGYPLYRLGRLAGERQTPSSPGDQSRDREHADGSAAEP